MGKNISEVAYIVSSTHDGRGIADMDGKKVFVAGALEGEKVMFQRRKRRRKYDEAELLEVLEPSSSRIKPRCDVFGRCGGCSLQHLSSDAQRDLKFHTLKDNLSRIGKVTPAEWFKSIYSSGENGSWNYRRRARLGVKYVTKKDRVLVGFRERYAPFITDMQRCEILQHPVNELINPLSVLIGSLSIKSHVPQIEIAIADHCVELVIRVLEPPSIKDRELLKVFSEKNGIRIALQTGGPNTIKALNLEFPAKPMSYSHEAHNIINEFISTDFIQINDQVNKLMVSKAIELLEPKETDRIIDLFCGIGNFTLPMARYAKEVIGFEISEELVQRAEHNAKLNNLKNIKFYTSDLFKLESNKTNLNCDKLLLDPARSGALEVVKNIKLFNAQKIVYVSCHPGTLARDADVLVNQENYKLDGAGIIDMFPHTAHVESIAVFSK
jgi:23S rRNA (uracil1939-C5)-methyltransferase|tara:strand:- start:11089 stop:12405 length:1317 start_codon:yes stop_codon:yes gene_type:complete